MPTSDIRAVSGSAKQAATCLMLRRPDDWHVHLRDAECAMSGPNMGQSNLRQAQSSMAIMQVTASSQTLTLRPSIRFMAASRRTTEAPPRPVGRRGRISECPRRPGLPSIPLKSRPNASTFWIMLLRGSAVFERGISNSLWTGSEARDEQEF
jgi:hypothetical protein